MFSELPKLFDRNFAMAFLLPFVVFFWLAVEILYLFGLSINLVSFVQVDLVVRTVIVFLVAWLGGILLLVTNQGLYRFLEGYGAWNPLRFFKKVEERRFRHLNDRIDELDEKFINALDRNSDIPPEEKKERAGHMLEFAKRFPHKAEYLLPTPFGNTIRAFEVYSTVMYGLEAIDGWSRLLAVTPKDYRELIDNAKTDVDFWINVGFLSVLLLLEYSFLAIWFGILPAWWMLIILLVSSVLAPRFARSSAVAWGDYIKAAFDMFRSQMREALLFVRPGNRQEESAQWTGFSQAIVFRSLDSMPPLSMKDPANGYPAGSGLTPPGEPVVPAPEPDISHAVLRFCSYCGRELQIDWRFCPNCGRKVSQDEKY
jgi:hypothetical protein